MIINMFIYIYIYMSRLDRGAGKSRHGALVVQRGAEQAVALSHNNVASCFTPRRLGLGLGLGLGIVLLRLSLGLGLE